MKSVTTNPKEVSHTMYNNYLNVCNYFLDTICTILTNFLHIIAIKFFIKSVIHSPIGYLAVIAKEAASRNKKSTNLSNMMITAAVS